MAKYSKEIIEKIVKLIEEDTYSITDICHLLYISRKTFYAWNDTKPEFAQSVKSAMKRRDERLIEKARLSLQKKLDNYTLTETKLKYVPDKDDPDKMVLKEKVVKIKEYAPDNGAIKIALTSKIPDKEELQKEQEKPFEIIVPDEKAKEQVEILVKNLSGGTRSISHAKEKLHSKTG